jgi:urease accessory protein
MLMVAPPIASRSSVPAFVRADGGIRLVIGTAGPLVVAERGGYRVRFVRSGEGVLINTGGGMTGGDRMRIDVAVEAGASAVLTTQAAEKIYRSDGPDTEIAAAIDLARGARLAWLPQEQILFDRSRLRRSLDVAMAGDAALTLVESVVFGRLAMGETVVSGLFRDRWRIRRDGRLVFAEDVRLDGPIAAILARKATGGGARAAATVLHVAPDAERRIEACRAMLAGSASECGVSAWDGMLVARFLSADPQALRTDLVRFLTSFRGEALPRSWQT